jgi:hypothetical protein
VYEEWEGKRIARQFAGHISKMWRTEGRVKTPVAKAVQAAVLNFYESKEAFFESFLKQLSTDQLQLFYKLLYEYLEEFNSSRGGVDPEVLAQIREMLRGAGVAGVEQVDASQTISPSSRQGVSPYKGGKGGGRQ